MIVVIQDWISTAATEFVSNFIVIIQNWFATVAAKFVLNFIEKDRWKYIAEGLGTTLLISLLAVIIGTVLGFLIAIIRATHDKTGRFRLLSRICNVYLTVVRGTPVVVQLMIIYFVIFSSVNISKVLCAILAFGLNSAAYVAEIFRSGIMSVDAGQMEAGRSLGLNYTQTMVHIIMPQAFKNVLPALGNEFIVLLKETSVSGFIALQDLTKAGDIIRSRTYEPFMPLIAVALIYLILVIIFTKLVNLLERRLRNSER
ncbi:MAG: amino acid ABC transporter permease [Lachnospiraceae bacterium]|jgi:His/Glu/Gln/Arg/opine family amino acid ABC transporter permease subunit